jgi:hypothetical protein
MFLALVSYMPGNCSVETGHSSYANINQHYLNIFKTKNLKK